EWVLDPAALGGRRSSLHELVPVLIHFLLVRAVHVEGHALGEAEVRTAVVAQESLAADDELGGADGAVLPGAGDVAHFGVRKGRRVDLDRRLELVVEHEERGHLVHGRGCSVGELCMVARQTAAPPRAQPWLYGSPGVQWPR